MLEVAGTMVTPGLIDLHAHVFEGFNGNGVHPDLGGVYAGVTTIVDAGSSGCATFRGFPRHIIPECHTEIIPFLHICQTGLATSPDIIAEGSIDLDGTLRVADQYKGLDLRYQGPDGVAGAGDPRHGDAPAGQARRPREWY